MLPIMATGAPLQQAVMTWERFPITGITQYGSLVGIRLAEVLRRHISVAFTLDTFIFAVNVQLWW